MAIPKQHELVTVSLPTDSNLAQDFAIIAHTLRGHEHRAAQGKNYLRGCSAFVRMFPGGAVYAVWAERLSSGDWA